MPEQYADRLMRKFDALSVPFDVQVAVLVRLFDLPDSHRSDASEVLLVFLRDEQRFATTHSVRELLEVALLIVTPATT